MIIRSVLAVLLLAACTSADPAPQQTAAVPIDSPPPGELGSAARGAVFAREQCAACHAVGDDGANPLAGAPPLREISRRYPVEQLEEAFAEGFVTTHSAMPEFVLDAGQNRDLIAYLASIQED
ncbi:MAG: c-type cytochrome [Brevundimonas sp.]|uniref:c-type cytochrome n=1 Tax=Brevundimonas sp. TaxID=1871086 RepID=UPI003918E7E5